MGTRNSPSRQAGGSPEGAGGSERVQGLVAVNLAAALFGTVALFGRIDASPIWIVASRAAFAAMALWGASWFLEPIERVRRPRGNEGAGVDPTRHVERVGGPKGSGGSTGGPTGGMGRRRGRPGHVPLLAGTGALLAIHWLTFFASVQWAGIAIATLTFAVFPLFTVGFESVVLRRRPGSREVAAAAAIVVAVGCLVDLRPVDSSHWLGALAGLSSALAFSAFGVASKKIGTGLSSLSVSMLQNVVVAALLLPLLPFTGGAPASGGDWMWLGVLGIVSTALMHQLYFFSLRRLSASTSSGFIALEPVYAILYAGFFFGEALTLRVGLSAGLIVGASLVMLGAEGRRSPGTLGTGLPSPGARS